MTMAELVEVGRPAGLALVVATLARAWLVAREWEAGIARARSPDRTPTRVATPTGMATRAHEARVTPNPAPGWGSGDTGRQVAGPLGATAEEETRA